MGFSCNRGKEVTKPVYVMCWLKLGFIKDSGRYLRCAICRETTTLTDIAYVDTQPISTGQEVAENVRVIGSHSTKIEAVVRQLLLIQAGDPGAKCLVFSSVSEFQVLDRTFVVAQKKRRLPIFD